MSQRRLKRATSFRSPSLSILSAEPGDLVLVNREKDKEWTGSYRLLIIDIERKTATVSINDSPVPLALHCVRPMITPTAAINFVTRRSS
mmetsp:Transcript_24126/g.59995  ORF Transcript_24126/g.59995 Transcript_24126/m.59995 type:complete len:89 (-) Transcript_24126:2261-2527(-)